MLRSLLVTHGLGDDLSVFPIDGAGGLIVLPSRPDGAQIVAEIIDNVRDAARKQASHNVSAVDSLPDGGDALVAVDIVDGQSRHEQEGCGHSQCLQPVDLDGGHSDCMEIIGVVLEVGHGEVNIMGSSTRR